jgi:hypothetical protein
MKKRIKKLSLNRETVRHLADEGLRDMGDIAGGAGTSDICRQPTWCLCGDTYGICTNRCEFTWAC